MVDCNVSSPYSLSVTLLKCSKNPDLPYGFEPLMRFVPPISRALNSSLVVYVSDTVVLNELMFCSSSDFCDRASVFV